MKRSTAAVLALAVVGLIILNSPGFFYPWYEVGDDAANSLSIFRAKHFAQLYGCFSRWGFYHPGPALFYVQGWGESVFYDWLHFCPRPHNAHVLAQLCLNVSFFVFALRTFTLWLPTNLRRWWFVGAASAFAILHFGDWRTKVFLNTWPAYPPVLLMLCLLTAGAAVAAGAGSELPFVILSAGFLVHSHVAQPLFVVPLTLLAYLGLLLRPAATSVETPVSSWRQRLIRPLGAGWRAWPRAHILSVILLFVFVLPLLIDLCRGADSNLAAIWHHVHTYHGERKKWLRSVFYFIQYGTYTFYKESSEGAFGHYDRPGMIAYLRAHVLILAFWVAVAATAVWAVVRQIPSLARRLTGSRDTQAKVPPPAVGDGRCFLAWAGIFLGAAIVLTLYWGVIQDGPMMYYSAYFNYGIYYFGALVALAVVCRWPFAKLSAVPGRPMAMAAWLAPAGLVAAAFGVQIILPHEKWTPRMYDAALHEQVDEAIAATASVDPTSPATPKQLVFSEEWSWAVPVALKLCRAGIPFLAPPEQKILIGAEHVWRPGTFNALQNGAQIWRIERSDVPAITRSVIPPKTLLVAQPPVILSVSAPMIDPVGKDGPAVIDFHSKGNASAYTLFGWSVSDSWGMWSDGHLATLAFVPAAIASGEVEMTVKTGPLMLVPQSGLVAQRLRVFFNGEPLGEVRLDAASANAKPPVFSIPAALWNRVASQKYSCAVVGFEMPDAQAPAHLDPTGRSTDGRLLGVGFDSLQFHTIPLGSNGPTATSTSP